jgi:hypothetical protein
LRIACLSDCLVKIDSPCLRLDQLYRRDRAPLLPLATASMSEFSRGMGTSTRAPGQHRRTIAEHIEGDGPSVFAHACKMGLEGIVSKRKESAYAPAARRIGSR